MITLAGWPGDHVPFVASERNSHWGKAIEVPGILPPGNPLCEPDSSACVAGQVLSVACGAGGTCAAGGWYDTPAISGEAAFVTVYKNGRWTKVTHIPGLEALDTAKQSSVRSVSCTPAGKCLGGGHYQASQSGAAFVADENNGTWGSGAYGPHSKLRAAGRWGSGEARFLRAGICST